MKSSYKSTAKDTLINGLADFLLIPLTFIKLPLLTKNLHEYKLNSKESQNPFATAFNFGPDYFSNKSVEDLVKNIISIWEGEYIINQNSSQLYESSKLNLISEKAFKLLNWRSKWNFNYSTLKTINWYKDVFKGDSPIDCCVRDILDYEKNFI